MAAPAPGEAIAESFQEICLELGCKPLEPLLTCLRERSAVAKVANIQDNEQLYAVATILPFANLQELDLSGLQLNSDQWCALLEACSRCSGLRVLSIKGCNLGALGPDAEAHVARQLGACRMSVLDASQNQLGDSFVASLSACPLLAESDVLTVLDLSENAIGDNGAAALAAAAAAAGLHSSLKQLDLSFNQLGDRAARALAQIMAAVPLLAMELEGNQISDIGGLAVADGLKQSLCLQRLNLNHNRLTSSTLASIADAVNVNPGNLQELTVAGSSGSEQGMAALLTAACKSKRLHLLDVRGLQLRGKAVDALCQLLGSSCPLVTLRLDVASRAAAETIAQALQGKTTLTHVMMGGNVPEHVLSFVAAALSANTLHKVQAARRNSVSPQPESPRQPRSSTPTQLIVQHQQLMQASPPAAAVAASAPASAPAGTSRGSPAAMCGPFGSGLQRPFSGGMHTPAAARSLSPSQSQSHRSMAEWVGLSSSTSTPLNRVLPFGSPGSTGSPTRTSSTVAQQRSPAGGAGGGSGSGGVRGNVRTLSMQARRASVIDNQGLAGLAGGGAANKAAEVFKRHDLDGSGYLDAEEMMSALQELGMLEGMRPRQLGKFLSDAIKEADTDKDGRVSMDEFTAYYRHLARHYAEAARQGRIVARRRPPEVPLDAPSDEALKRTFRTYCRLPIGQGRQVGASVQQINAAQFHQLCRDAGLVEPAGSLSQCAVDIIFTRVKPPGSRRLPFRHFLGAIAAVADEAGLTFDAVTTAMNSMDDPVGGPRPPALAPSASFTHSRRHSISALAHTQLSISDLTDTRVGPSLPSRSSTPPRVNATAAAAAAAAGSGPQRPASASAELLMGRSISTPTRWSIRMGAGAAGGGGAAAVGGSGAAGAGGDASAGGAGGNSAGGASPPLTSRSANQAAGSLGATLNINTPRAEQLLQQAREQAAAKQQQQQQQEQEQQQQRLSVQQQQEHKGSSGGKAAEPLPLPPPQQHRLTSNSFALADHDAVHNPLFEGEADGSVGGAGGQEPKSISHRLLALERKILQRVSAGSTGGGVSTAQAPHAGALEQRLSGLEASVEETQQQLSAVMGQQGELKGLLEHLLEGLEATGGGAPRDSDSSSTLKAISESLGELAAEVASLKAARLSPREDGAAGLQEQLNQLALSTDKRHSRVETAIYQVAHQVDLLDARVKQEQQSSLRTMQALFAASSAAASGTTNSSEAGM